MKGYMGIQLLCLWLAIFVARWRGWISPSEVMNYVADFSLVIGMAVVAAAILARLLRVVQGIVANMNEQDLNEQGI